MEVEYNAGRLRIRADHASLAEVLGEVQRQTGTDIPIPPGAAQEQIIASDRTSPIREALVSLLNGSRFNFIMVDSESEPGKLKSVILTYRGAGGISQPAMGSPVRRPRRTPTRARTSTDGSRSRNAPPTRRPKPARRPPHQEGPPPQ